MHEETKHISTFNDIPVLLARIDDKLGIIAAWIQNGASQQDPHAILTIDEAVAFTGYSKSAIHSATSKDKIPHFKRGNKLFFFKDELVEWLKSDSRPKRGKRFQVNDNSKESVVTNSNQESVSITVETANDTNSVAEVTDTTSSQAKKATSVPEEAVPTCQGPETSTLFKTVSDAGLEQNGSNEKSKDPSKETLARRSQPTPTSGTVVDSCMDRREKMYSSNGPLAAEHISNDSVKQQGKENTIPSFPYFSLERHDATDGTPAKSVIHFFDKIPHNQYYMFAGLPRTDTASELSRTPSALSSPPMTMLFRLRWLSTNTCRQALIIVTNVTSNSKPKLFLQTMLHSVIHTYLWHPAPGISSQHCDALRESFCRNAPSSLGYWLNGGTGASSCSEMFRTRCSQLGFPLCVSP